MSQILEFGPFDNPMQLSKIGNWLITYLSPIDDLEQIQLAISYVLPRQVSDELQARRIIIDKLSEQQHLWHIYHIECYDSSSQQEVIIHPDHPLWNTILENMLLEFAKYDVDAVLKVIE